MIPKFRFYNLKLNKIYEVVSVDWLNEQVDCILPEMNEDIANWDWNVGVLIQSTGLKDKNGVEIFEGDIVKVTDESWGADFIVSNVIWFGDTEWQYPAFDLNGLYIPKDFHFEANALNTCILENEVEIIGSQYEHPHLLEE